MKNKSKIMIVLLVFLGACSSDNTSQDDPPDMSVNDARSGKDIAENDIKDADLALDTTDQDSLKVCEAIPPEFIFEPETNLEKLLGCEIVLSPIEFVEYFETKITGLDSLRELGPKAILNIHLTPNLVDMDTFANLELVKSDVLISDAPVLTNLKGFRKLRRIEGWLSLVAISIKNFDGLQNLEYVGELFLDLYDLVSFEGLENLSEVKGDFSLSAPKISETQFREFLEGKTIGGDIRFQNKPFVR